MNFEVLKRSHLKRNIIIGVVVVAIISAIILNFTRAKYRVTQSIPLVNGTINYKPYDFKMIAMYQENDSGEYENIDIVPSSGYYLNDQESYCETNGVKNNDINIQYGNQKIDISNLSQKGTKCYLYFNKNIVKECSDEDLACQTLLKNVKIIGKRNNFTKSISIENSDMIYAEEDDDGLSYYFVGSPTNNWIRFADFYWRIIRINGDGSLRLIYSGNNQIGPTQTGFGVAIGISYFNNNGDNAYVGYMYGNPGSNTYEETHANINDSIIKNYVDDWYKNNIYGTEYEQYIDKNAGFCGDRSISSGTGIKQDETYYNGFRLGANYREAKPSLKCVNEQDLYTVTSSNKGNKALTYPIGLITLDEVIFSGFAWRATENINNRGHYLSMGHVYWTMTPVGIIYREEEGIYAQVFYVNKTGPGWGMTSSSRYHVRPVINLRADIVLNGTGDIQDPYVIAT